MGEAQAQAGLNGQSSRRSRGCIHLPSDAIGSLRPARSRAGTADWFQSIGRTRIAKADRRSTLHWPV